MHPVQSQFEGVQSRATTLDYRDAEADETLRSKVRWILVAATVLAVAEIGMNLAQFGMFLFPNAFGGLSSAFERNGRTQWVPIVLVITSTLLWAGLLVCAALQLRGRDVRRALVYFAAATIAWPLCITVYYQFRNGPSPYRIMQVFWSIDYFLADALVPALVILFFHERGMRRHG